MKYGLRSDKHHCSKMKWKLSMENDIATLKTEVSTLKLQLKSSLDMINLLLLKNSAESNVKECRQCTTKKDESDNFESNNYKCVGFKINAPVEIKLEHVSGKPTSAPFFLFSPNITTRYKATQLKEDGDYKTYKQLSCITAMPEYNDWSMEELRLQFYKAAYQNKNQLFYNEGLKGILTGTGFVKYSPSWDYDPIIKRSVCIHNISVLPCFQSKSLEELRLEDYVLKGNNLPKQNSPVEDIQMRKSHEKLSDYNSQRHEELLIKIISELGKMDTKLTSVNNQVSSVDANLFEIRSQMSMMDSRLSAVDMFITMKRMDKKWQGLSSSLQTLESPSERVEFPTENEIKIAPSCSIQSNNSQSSPLAKKTLVNCNKEIKSAEMLYSVKSKLDLSHKIMFIATEDTILISHLPMCSETFLNESAKIQTTNPLIIKPSTVFLEKTLKEENIISPLDENSDTLVLQNEDNPFKNNIQLNAKNMESDTIQTVNSILLSQEPDGQVLKDTNIKFQSDCDKDDEFVIVNKSDVVDFCNRSSKENNSSTCSNASTDYKICNSITEYLEVNVGKRKDLVYEFGWEAKPDCITDSVFDSSFGCPSQDTNQTNPNISGIKDDSFLLYINNLIESNTVNHKQNTPVSSTKQSSKNFSEQLKVSKSKDTVLSYKLYCRRKFNSNRLGRYVI